MTALCAVAGLVLLLALVVDVFSTVFVPRGAPGPVTRRFYSGVWSLVRRLASRADGSRRRRLLALGGPLLLPLTVALWALELVLGFTLVYVPLADGFSYPEGAASPPGELGTALYFSGYSATTLGVGDVYASGSLLRLLSVTEAALGFALFSVSIAYVLSVYNGLRSSTALALEISRYLGDQPLDVLSTACRVPAAEQELTSWLGTVGGSLSEVAQAQEQYALLSYFHIPDDPRALPLALGDLLEVVTVCRSLVNEDAAPSLVSGLATQAALRTGVAHVQERASTTEPRMAEAAVSADAREAAYECARDRLRELGVPLRPEPAARLAYLGLRASWDEQSLAMRKHFGYDVT
jgi:hypothetical protein